MAKVTNVLKGGIHLTVNGGINVTVNGVNGSDDKVSDLDWKVNEIAKGLDRLAVGINARCQNRRSYKWDVDPVEFTPDQIRSMWADFRGLDATLKEERRQRKSLEKDLEGAVEEVKRLREKVAILETIIGKARSALAEA